MSNLTPQEILKNVIDATHMSVRAFAIHMGLTYMKVFSIYSGRTKQLSPDVRKRIVDVYGVNEHYLLTGEGDIFPSQKMTEPNELVKHLFSVIDLLRDENRQLKTETTNLKNEIALLSTLKKEVKEEIVSKSLSNGQEETHEGV